jgi:hypothetical protein
MGERIRPRGSIDLVAVSAVCILQQSAERLSRLGSRQGERSGRNVGLSFLFIVLMSSCGVPADPGSAFVPPSAGSPVLENTSTPARLARPTVVGAPTQTAAVLATSTTLSPSLAPPAATTPQGPPSPQGRVTLAFSTIAQGAATGGQETSPVLRLVRTDQQRTALDQRISPQDRPALGAVDLSQNVVIAAFQRVQPTSGYQIDIRAVAIDGQAIEVTVDDSAPDPADVVRHGFETPYHLVQIARSPFDAQSITQFQLRDGSGNLLDAGAIAAIEQQ